MRGGGCAGLALVIAAAAGGCAYNAQSRAAGWTIAETENVSVQTSAPPGRAAEIAAELQAIRDTLVAGSVMKCAFSGGDDRIMVTVLSDSEFGDIATRNTAGMYRHWPISWLPEYEGQLILPDDMGRGARQLYQHELTHHMIAACFPNVPVWLGEGLAKFLETVVVDGDELLVGIPPFAILRRTTPHATVYRGVQVIVLPSYLLPPLRSVLAMPSEQFYLRHAHDSLRMAANYAAAWALVHMLELGSGDLHERFTAFLGGLSRLDADPAALLAKHFEGVDLQARFNTYVWHGEMPYVRLAARAPRRAAARVRSMSAGDAHVHWAWLWAGVHDEDDRRRRVAEHLAAAREDPASRARAHLMAAALLVRDEDQHGAEREVLDGLRAAPADPTLLQALVELRLMRGADPSSSADRLRPVALTADQRCALGAVELARGQPNRALGHAMRGLQSRPRSLRCRKLLDLARGALRANRPARGPGA